MSKRQINCKWRVSRTDPVVKNASDDKVSRINQRITEIPSDIKESTVVLFLNKNPFKTLKGLATLQNLRELYLDSTKLSSLKYANDQPSLEIITFFDTPFYEQPQSRIMCGLAFQKLREVNKIVLSKKEREFCELHGKELRLELYEGLILTAVNPIRWINPETKKKIEFYPNSKPIKRHYLEINQKYPPKKKISYNTQQQGKKPIKNIDIDHKKLNQDQISKLNKPSFVIDDMQDNDNAFPSNDVEEDKGEEEENQKINISKFAQFSSDDDSDDNFTLQNSNEKNNISLPNKQSSFNEGSDIPKSNPQDTSTAAAAAVSSLATRLGLNIGNDSDSDSDMQTDYFNKMANYNKDFIQSLQTSSAYSSLPPDTDKSKESRRKHRKGQQSGSVSYSSNIPDNKEKDDINQNIPPQQQAQPSQQNKDKSNKNDDDYFTVDYTDYNTSTIHPQKQEQKKQSQPPPQQQQQQQQQKSPTAKDDQYSYYDYTDYTSTKPSQQKNQPQNPPQQQKAPAVKNDQYSDYDYTDYTSTKPAQQQKSTSQQQKAPQAKDDQYSDYEYTDYTSTKPTQPQKPAASQQQQQKAPPSKDDQYSDYDYTDYTSTKPPKQQNTQQQQQKQTTQPQQQNQVTKDDQYSDYDYTDYTSTKPAQQQKQQVAPQQQQKVLATKDDQYSDYDYTDYTSTKPAQSQQKAPQAKDDQYSDYEYTDYTSAKPAQQQQKLPPAKDDQYSDYDYTDYTSSAQK